MDKARKNGTALHLMGLLSDGGVHSHNSIFTVFLNLLRKTALKMFMFTHSLTAVMFRRHLQLNMQKSLNKIKEIGVGKIATVKGRYYAMDRDNIWDRVEKAYGAMVYGEGNNANAVDARIKTSYQMTVSILQTNLLCPQLSKTAKLKKMILWYSLTSVLTVQEK